MFKICLIVATLVVLIFFSMCVFSKAAIDNESLLKRSTNNIQIERTPATDTLEKYRKKWMPPVPASFSPADSVRFIKTWTLGLKFYRSNCSKCHGIFGKGKDSIPNFSKEQMDDYQGAALANDKANHAAMSNMTQDELNAVFIFLTNIRRE